MFAPVRRLLALLLVVIVVVVALPRLRPDVPAAERGRELAARIGCFGCHGPDGTHGTPNPGRTDRTVPGFGSDVMMYAKTHLRPFSQLIWPTRRC